MVIKCLVTHTDSLFSHCTRKTSIVFVVQDSLVCVCRILEMADLNGENIKNQGPVVQSIVSLTSSFRGQLFKCFTTL